MNSNGLFYRRHQLLLLEAIDVVSTLEHVAIDSVAEAVPIRHRYV